VRKTRRRRRPRTNPRGAAERAWPAAHAPTQSVPSRYTLTRHCATGDRPRATSNRSTPSSAESPAPPRSADARPDASRLPAQPRSLKSTTRPSGDPRPPRRGASNRHFPPWRPAILREPWPFRRGTRAAFESTEMVAEVRCISIRAVARWNMGGPVEGGVVPWRSDVIPRSTVDDPSWRPTRSRACFMRRLIRGGAGAARAARSSRTGRENRKAPLGRRVPWRAM